MTDYSDTPTCPVSVEEAWRLVEEGRGGVDGVGGEQYDSCLAGRPRLD